MNALDYNKRNFEGGQRFISIIIVYLTIFFRHLPW